MEGRESDERMNRWEGGWTLDKATEPHGGGRIEVAVQPSPNAGTSHSNLLRERDLRGGLPLHTNQVGHVPFIRSPPSSPPPSPVPSINRRVHSNYCKVHFLYVCCSSSSSSVTLI